MVIYSLSKKHFVPSDIAQIDLHLTHLYQMDKYIEENHVQQRKYDHLGLLIFLLLHIKLVVVHQ